LLIGVIELIRLIRLIELIKLNQLAESTHQLVNLVNFISCILTPFPNSNTLVFYAMPYALSAMPFIFFYSHTSPYRFSGHIGL
jgi:hypothetical protein